MLAVKLGLTAVLLYLVLRQIDWRSAIDASRRLTLSTIAISILLTALQVVVAAARWAHLQMLGGRSVGFLNSLRGTFIERLVNQAVPSTLGGDVMRVLELRGHGIDLREATYSVLIDRGMAVLGLVVLIALCLPASAGMLAGTGIDIAIWIVLAASAVGIAAIVFFAERLPTEMIGKALSLGTGLVFLNRVRTSLVDPRYLLPALGWSVLMQLFSVPIVTLVASDVGEPVSVISALIVVPPATLFSLIPLTIGGWGLREGAMIVLLGLTGVSASAAGVIGLTLSCALLAVGLLCGVVWMVWNS